jgi:delta 1-pyrroline-5-carboxylate dehydrogenase
MAYPCGLSTESTGERRRARTRPRSDKRLVEAIALEVREMVDICLAAAAAMRQDVEHGARAVGHFVVPQPASWVLFD